MKLWVRTLLLLPFIPVLLSISYIALIIIILSDKSQKKINRNIERGHVCETIHVGHYVVCKNPACDFKEFA